MLNIHKGINKATVKGMLVDVEMHQANIKVTNESCCFNYLLYLYAVPKMCFENVLLGQKAPRGKLIKKMASGSSNLHICYITIQFNSGHKDYFDIFIISNLG